ncbi:MAG: DNA polymerase I [Alphaproteobacteria bacterium]|nr:DNA polymerase I [Alphaproteobacteria bacterium]
MPKKLPEAGKAAPESKKAIPAQAEKPAAGKKNGGHLYLVDGSGYIFRAYHALPPLTRADGTPVGAVLGFTNMLLRLMAGHRGDHLAVIFDAGRDTFRNEIYAEYKANRDEPPDDLIPQFGLVREATRAFGVPAIEKPGWEADDLIACYARSARKQGMQVTIVSSDKDLMQLVGEGIEMLDPIKNKPIREPEVLERFGVTPDKVVFVQALAGDSTDNVPGVPGIGVKTAAELINLYGDLETLLARAGEIKQPKRRESLLTNADKARISYRLVKLDSECGMPLPIAELGIREPDPKILVDFLAAQGFRSVISRMKTEGLVDGDFDVESVPRMSNGALPLGQPSRDGQSIGSAVKAPTAIAPPALKPGAGRGYALVQTMKDLDGCIESARAAGLVAIDTETTGLNAHACELVGISLATAVGEGRYIPVGHVMPGAAATEEKPQGGLALDQPKANGGLLPGQLPRDRVLEALKPLLADPSVLKVGHHIKFDAEVLRRYGVAVEPIDDTMLLSYVLAGGKHGHGMDELSALHLGHKTISYDEVTGTGKQRINFAEVPLEKARDYAAEDADVTLCLHTVLKPLLVSERLVSVYEGIERPLIPIIQHMEETGIAVDPNELKRLSNDFALRLAELEKQIHKEAKRPFNIGSPAQLGVVLFDELGLQLPEGEQPKKTKTGAYATGADVLESLAATGHKVPQLVLEWRQLSKLKSTYTDALIEAINPRTGRVHTSYAMAVASTGRLSSNDPNLQNIPVRTEEGRKIRRAFVAGKGLTLLSFDYSQIELRLLAHVADIAALKEAFRQGIDIHALTASQVFGVPVKGMDPMVRRKAKAINFGIIYGISAFGLANQLGIPQSEARAYIGAYFEKYPGIRDYMERTKKEAHAQGYVTTVFGRRCHVPQINEKNPAIRSFAERAAINAPIQGGAADIIKRAMVRIPAALAKAKLSAAMLLQVHDELLFEAPPSEVAKTIEVVKAAMEGADRPAVSLSVPLVVEVGQGLSWAEAH